MKRILTLCITLCVITSGFAQVDTTGKEKADTIKVGGMIIIKRPGEKREIKREKDVSIPERKSSKNSNVSTNWWIVDLGFNNIKDNTVYGSADANSYLVGTPPFTKDDMKLRAGKSVNVNVWIFMQKLNIIKHVVNLKYGLGVELFNFRYKKNNNISYKEANPPIIFRDTVQFSKNKLAADYVTVPLMLNFNTTPRAGNKGFSFSAGVSAGYLYSNRNKQESNERGKQKEKGDIGLNRFKLSYVGELGLGPVRLYGTYAITNLYDRSIDQHPYAVGIRFSNW
jgi:hypothetical protein